MIDQRLNLTLVAGTRPNFMKIASLIHAIKKRQDEGVPIIYRLIHTGQHYDNRLSNVFFEDLEIPQPYINLDVGSGSHAQQTAAIMIRFEEFLQNNPTDWVIVVGDVNSTLACSLVAKKMGVKVAHVEAGIRSNDRTMPEEINRLATDAITDVFFTTSVFANERLAKEGKDSDNVYFVGNTMIDSLIRNLSRSNRPELLSAYDIWEKEYFLLTLHRPSNVDDPQKLRSILQSILDSTDNGKLIFSVHPRTQKHLDEINFEWPIHVVVTGPMRYLEFLYLIKNSKAVITDSGGIQEETTYLHVPCLTLRLNTERPETISVGTNILIGGDMKLLVTSIRSIQEGKWKKGSIPEKWDGNTGERIVDILFEITD
jgi:UDP-N-acetylglucosamine 2-epimerase (non-hydrolysing)